MVDFKVIRENNDKKFAQKVIELVNQGYQIVNCVLYRGANFGYFLKK